MVGFSFVTPNEKDETSSGCTYNWGERKRRQTSAIFCTIWWATYFQTSLIKSYFEHIFIFFIWEREVKLDTISATFTVFPEIYNYDNNGTTTTTTSTYSDTSSIISGGNCRPTDSHRNDDQLMLYSFKIHPLILISVLFPFPQVQTEIKKTWTRWNMTHELDVPVVCGRYGYRSVTVSLNNNSSSQFHLAGVGPSTRSTLLVSSPVYRSTSPRMMMHATLPGYVVSNSDPSIPEELEESTPKQVDNISLKENLPVFNTSATAEDEEETL